MRWNSGGMSSTAVDTMSWRQARRLLAAVDQLPPIAVPLHAAVGAVLVAPITAPTDIPVGDAAVDHGWAVAGQGPWTVVSAEDSGGLASLPGGHAVAVGIGDPLPEGATAVVRRGEAVIDIAPHRVRLQMADADGQPAAHPGLATFGAGIQPQGADARQGQRLLTAGPVVTPATVGLAAAVGRDDLTVIPPPSVTVLLPNYGLARRGPLRPGRQRDIVADLLPSWIEAGSARLMPTVAVPARADEIAEAVADSSADVIVVAGGLEPGIPEAVVEAGQRLAPHPLVAGLSVAPGGETAVYPLPGERYLIALPGRPAAAAAGLAVVLEPLLAALSGRHSTGDEVEALLSAPVAAGPVTRLVPGILRRSELVFQVHPQPWSGPAGMQALAAADGLIVVEAGTQTGSLVPLLPLPGVLVG